jgi:carboxyl-terminal processing protease
MFRKTLIATNVVMLVTACSLPFAKDRDIQGALDHFETAYAEKYGNTDQAEEARDLFGDVLARINSQYVDTVEPDKLVDAAISSFDAPETEGNKDEEPVALAITAMMASLDKYSAYMDPSSYKRYQNSLDGKFEGFGFRIEMRGELLTVIAPLKGSAAEEAGIQANDVITHINDQPLKGHNLIEAVTILRGPTGTRAVLTIMRPEVDTPLKLSVQRRAIDVEAVEYRIDGDVGYLKISTFNKNTAGDVNEALAYFDDKLGSRLCGVILDMRNNPGGLVSSAVEVTDQFLENGNIFSAINRGKSFSKEDAESGDRIDGRPIMVMLNKSSASAAEIVAGALKYTNRAQVIGQKSFGKGTMQTLYNLDNGGGIRLTTGRFTVGGGASFNGLGIVPDIVDKVTDEEPELASIARAGNAMSCTLSVRTAASGQS